MIQQSTDRLAMLEERIQTVRDNVAAAAARVNRDPSSVTIIGVTKTVDRDAVDLAYQAGLRHFGENRVQDAARKFAIPLPDDATLSMIGHLQSNKANRAVRLFQVIESVDRPSIIDALERAAALVDRTLPVLLQVNIAGEMQKAGCAPDDAAALCQRIEESPHLRLRGLMTIAPLVEDAEEVRPCFLGLRRLRDELAANSSELDLSILSMGMTNDYQIAIEEGATHIRVGRAIFS
ncbi:MAG TPA: YggS family pyridoxal phosphate-dependent enzyme [Thermomicrobiales bacterium]|nr:YggS family pyridoxal phosphate-dependent enzyme [Thermomicrobiales bacterium]